MRWPVHYDLLVVEPTALVTGNAGFDMKAMLAKLGGQAIGYPAYLDACSGIFPHVLAEVVEGADQDGQRRADFILTPIRMAGRMTTRWPTGSRWQAIFATDKDAQVHQ